LPNTSRISEPLVLSGADLRSAEHREGKT
jgi:hypothetical protein